MKTTETEIERTYIDKEKTKSIGPQKRNTVESSEDSPSSVVDAQKEVEGEETIESVAKLKKIKIVESFKRNEVKRRKTVSLSDSIQDSSRV